MEIKVIADDIVSIKAGAIVLNFFEGMGSPSGDMASVDRALGGAISELIRQGEIRGKSKEITLIHSLGKLPAARVVIAGLGKPTELSLNKIRGAVAETCRWLRQKGIDDIATVAQGAGTNGISLGSAAQAVAEGALLGLYSFRTHVTKKDDDHVEVKQLSIVGTAEARPSLEQGSIKGKILAEATNLARNLVNEPANYMTPSHMAEAAVRLASTYGLEVKVLEPEQMRELGMGALLGVAQGSRQPPKFIILNYKDSNSAEIDVALVGKGITFDSGGISIKPSEGLARMKGDKAGGVAVMAAISAIAQLKPRMMCKRACRHLNRSSRSWSTASVPPRPESAPLRWARLFARLSRARRRLRWTGMTSALMSTCSSVVRTLPILLP